MCAASTKSLSFSRNVSARTTRIMVGICAMPSAIAALVSPPPLIAARPTASTRNGNASIRSASRDTTASTQRQYPASSPSGTPTTSATSTDSTPTCSDARMP